MFEIERVLCPTDFSDESLEALTQANDIALKFGAEIYLVHVLPILPALPNDPNFVFKVPEYERSLHGIAQKHLDEIAHERIEKGVRTKTIVGHGDAASEIVRIAEEQRVGLIVIATFGKTGWRRFAFGSVAERVVRLATCPVLTVRGVDRSVAAD
jgi:nucleotide-binding universal stress UspA family protein